MDRNIGSSPSIPPDALDAVSANASSRQLFAQFKQLLEAAEAKVSGYHELNAMLQYEQRSIGQLERALHLQQRHIDRFTAQDFLVSQLTQQLTVQSHTLEQLRSSCNQRSKQLDNCQAHASALQQEVGQKRKRIDSLMEHGMYQDKRIRCLEKKLQQYKSLCSYVASESQVRRLFLKIRLPRMHIAVCLVACSGRQINSQPHQQLVNFSELLVQDQLWTLELPFPLHVAFPPNILPKQDFKPAVLLHCLAH